MASATQASQRQHMSASGSTVQTGLTVAHTWAVIHSYTLRHFSSYLFSTDAEDSSFVNPFLEEE